MTARSWVCSVLALLLCGAGGVLWSAPTSVTVRSLESKTVTGAPVYNRISFESRADEDIWRMRQSHGGLHAPLGEWDEIKIVVDKRPSPVEVSYHQLKDGREVELKAVCFTCHSNGPRAIRPDFEATDVTYSWRERVALLVWNLRIKSYGKVVIKRENYKLSGKFRVMPLKYFGKIDGERLTVATCVKCHNDNGPFARGRLERQHRNTIVHLTESGQMPPWPYELSEVEEQELARFVRGF